MEKLYDVGAERAVLAGLLQHGMDAYVTVSDIISTDAFGNANNQAIYKCIEKCIAQDQKVDIAALLAAAQHLELSETINTDQELKYINSLYDFPISPENVLSFAAQIKKFEFARKIKRLVNKVSKDVESVSGTETIDEIIQILELK